MQPNRIQRAPGSFSPLPGSMSSSAAVAAAAASSGHSSGNRDDPPPPPPPMRPPPQPYQQHSSSQFSSRPQIRRIESSSSDDTTSQISIAKIRSPKSPTGVTSPTASTSFAQLSNSSSNSLHNFSRPGRALPNTEPSSVRTGSPLTLPPRGGLGLHSRKHSQTQGMFDSKLSSTSTLSLITSNMDGAGSGSSVRSPSGALPASHIAAQAAVQQHQQHSRHRSQTVPFPGSEMADTSRRPSARPVQGGGSEAGGSSRGPMSPPTLSLTEASVPRDGGALLGPTRSNEQYHNLLLAGHSSVAREAANVVFPRASPQSSPAMTTPDQTYQSSPFLPPLSMPDKPLKSEKSKVKLFSRPKKIDIKGESKEKPLPSPSKIGTALASLQRGNFSTASLVDSGSMYNLANSSSATIRPSETPVEGPATKEKEKKHHFLSRQKHKISGKDDYHLPLSSAASNSRPVDPNAPSSLYNFNLPPASPAPTSTTFSKSVSGLDLRHGGRALRDKRKEDKLGMAHENESVFTLNPSNSNSEWPGPSSLGSSLTQTQSNLTVAMYDPVDGSKYGLHNMTLDDAWPYLKSKLLNVFEGEDLRLPIEDFNRVVSMHIQWCIQRRSAHIIIEDLREMLSTGFASLDHTLCRRGTEDTNRLIPALVDVWMATFTSILPYMQAVFLPLDLEFAGNGPLLTADQARDFWGGVTGGHGTTTKELSAVLDVRRLVLLAFRDGLILPRYDKLKTIFSRLSLEHLPSSLASLALASPPLISEGVMSTSPRDNPGILDTIRPGTAMSLDPSLASYNSSSSTLLNEASGQGSNPSTSRSRAISNVSFGSGASGDQGFLRPFGPGRGRADSDRDRNRDQEAESGSKQVTDMVGRMLQCMSVLASISGNSPQVQSDAGGAKLEDAGSKQVAELGRLLKLNWLGRGRTGRNRRGMVGGRIKRDLSAQRTVGGHSRANSALAGGGAVNALGIGLGGFRDGVSV